MMWWGILIGVVVALSVVGVALWAILKAWQQGGIE